MAYSLTNLQDDIRNYTEVGSNVLSDSVLARIIQNAENKILRSIDTDQNVYSLDHQRAAGSIVRFRGPAQVTSAGSGGEDATNLQAFANIPTFNNVSDIDSATGFTITVGQKNSDGSVTTAPGDLTSPENYFFFTSTDTATTSGVVGGGPGCSAGPVTLKVVNG